MSLESLRNKTLESVRLGLDNENLMTLLDHAAKWFDSYKLWEAEETWERAFSENRMTVRIASNEVKEFVVKGHTVFLNSTVQGALDTQDPNVFIKNQKNDKGLHDVAAVLLRSSVKHAHEKTAPPISQQAFTKMGDYIFMPIPLEEDLQLFYELSAAAKQANNTDFTGFIVKIRASMTRLKFGDPNDMMAGFGTVDKGGIEKVRYGVANIQGNNFSQQVLMQRTHNAQHYQSKIIQVMTTEGNNEVTMKIRNHAGDFPWLGFPRGSGKIPINFKNIPPKSFFMTSIKTKKTWVC